MIDNDNIDKIIENANERIEKIKKEVKETISINTSNLTKECQHNPQVFHRFVSLLAKEKQRLKKLKRARRHKYNTLYRKLRWHFKRKLTTKKEIESFIYTNDEYEKLSEIYDLQSTFVEYLEGVVESARNRGFALRNMVELRKLDKEPY